MAEWVIPVEHETGIPLVFAPRYDIPKNSSKSSEEADLHHAVYPKIRPSLRTVAGCALRGARVQFVEYNEHRTFHYYFDDYMTEVWDIPDTVIESFGMTAMLVAGYIAEKAIRCGRHGPEYVMLSERQRELMWQRRIVRVSDNTAVYKFFRDTVVEQKLDHVNETDIDEFLFGDASERVEKGNQLIDSAAEVATEDVRPRYIAAYAGRLLLPTAPAEPKLLVLSILDSEKRQRKARTALARSLALQRGISLADIGLELAGEVA